MRPETVKLLEKNIGKKHLDVGLGNFFDMTPKAQATKDNGLCQTKTLLHSKGNNRMKR